MAERVIDVEIRRRSFPAEALQNQLEGMLRLQRGLRAETLPGILPASETVAFLLRSVGPRSPVPPKSQIGLGERHPLTERKQLTLRTQESGVFGNQLVIGDLQLQSRTGMRCRKKRINGAGASGVEQRGGTAPCLYQSDCRCAPLSEPVYE